MLDKTDGFKNSDNADVWYCVCMVVIMKRRKKFYYLEIINAVHV